MSAPAKSEVRGSLKKSIKDKNSENMKSIQADCNMDFELQAVVMAAIQGHKMANMNTATGSLLEAIAKEDEAKAQRIKALKEAKPADLDQPPEGVLRRGQFYYRKWGPGFAQSSCISVSHCCEIFQGLHQECAPGLLSMLSMLMMSRLLDPLVT